MKPIFGFDITENKYNEENFSGKFLVKEPREDLKATLDEKNASFESTVKAAKLPMALRLTEYLCSVFGIMVVGAIITSDVGAAQAIRNIPILSLLGIFSAIFSGILFIISKIRANKVLIRENAEGKLGELETATADVYRDLEVPEGAPDVDILIFKYKVKEGKIKPVTRGFETTYYINHAMKAYVSEEKLCLADVSGVFALPLEDIKAIKTVKKNTVLPHWNKETKHNSGEYKEFKISTNQYGYIVKHYHIILLERDGEEYGLYFPSFDRPIFEILTNMTAEEATK